MIDSTLREHFCGFMAIGSAMRVSHGIVRICIAAVRLSNAAAAVSASILGPLSIVTDIAFLAGAAYHKAKDDKTNAGKQARTERNSQY